MKAWLATAVAAVLLLGDAARDEIAPQITAGYVRGCATQLYLDEADCANTARTLATFADEAYDDGPATMLPKGFRPAALADLSLPGGRFANGSAKALITTGVLDRASVLVVAFRGSDDTATWLADLRNIDALYREFRPLVRAIERYAEAGGKAVLVGHSAGGAVVQLFMYAHARDDHYRAVTFGSPGALPQAHVFAAQPDARITNYAVADDPFVFLGEHRADVASYARRDWIYALALASAIAHESGLSVAQIVGSEPYLSANYVNNGVKVLLPGSRSMLSVQSVIGADPEEHEMTTYSKLVGSGTS
jgi:pimeloyl-ACP methyl ester carboxylesterase